MKKAILYIHGKGGSYLEAEQYRKNCPDFDVMGIDYDVDFPWIVQKQIKLAYDRTHKHYDHICVLANSIGAYFAMHTLQACDLEKAFFISPVLDMERLILDMMSWTKVSEKDLQERGEIPTIEKYKKAADEKMERWDKNGAEVSQGICNFYRASFKNTEEIISMNEFIFNKYKEVSEIHIFGHSLGEVDMPYF